MSAVSEKVKDVVKTGAALSFGVGMALGVLALTGCSSQQSGYATPANAPRNCTQMCGCKGCSACKGCDPCAPAPCAPACNSCKGKPCRKYYDEK